MLQNSIPTQNDEIYKYTPYSEKEIDEKLKFQVIPTVYEMFGTDEFYKKKLSYQIDKLCSIKPNELKEFLELLSNIDKYLIKDYNKKDSTPYDIFLTYLIRLAKTHVDYTVQTRTEINSLGSQLFKSLSKEQIQDWENEAELNRKWWAEKENHSPQKKDALELYVEEMGGGKNEEEVKNLVLQYLNLAPERKLFYEEKAADYNDKNKEYIEVAESVSDNFTPPKFELFVSQQAEFERKIEKKKKEKEKEKEKEKKKEEPKIAEPKEGENQKKEANVEKKNEEPKIAEPKEGETQKNEANIEKKEEEAKAGEPKEGEAQKDEESIEKKEEKQFNIDFYATIATLPKIKKQEYFTEFFKKKLIYYFRQVSKHGKLIPFLIERIKKDPEALIKEEEEKAKLREKKKRNKSKSLKSTTKTQDIRKNVKATQSKSKLKKSPEKKSKGSVGRPKSKSRRQSQKRSTRSEVLDESSQESVDESENEETENEDEIQIKKDPVVKKKPTQKKKVPKVFASTGVQSEEVIIPKMSREVQVDIMREVKKESAEVQTEGEGLVLKEVSANESKQREFVKGSLGVIQEIQNQILGSKEASKAQKLEKEEIAIFSSPFSAGIERNEFPIIIPENSSNGGPMVVQCKMRLKSKVKNENPPKSDKENFFPE